VDLPGIGQPTDRFAKRCNAYWRGCWRDLYLIVPAKLRIFHI
jgi:hypothetical protein